MSYEQRRHGRGGGDRRREDRRMPETEEQKLRNLIIRIGDNASFQPATELPSIANTLRAALPSHLPAIAEAFRISITEQPYKTPYTAALFFLIAQPLPASDETAEIPTTSPAQPVFHELCKAFQLSLDRLAWRDLRLTVHFFAHLALFKVIRVASFLELLQSFLVVLDEPGVSYERMEAAALCVGDGLLRAGSLVFDHDSAAVEAMISTIRSCPPLTQAQRALARPMTLLHTDDIVGASELLDSLVQVLDTQLATSFKESVECIPQTHTLFSPSGETIPLEIPSSMVPPEDFDFGGLTDDTSSRRIMMPRVSLRFFDNEISPPYFSVNGFVIRSCIVDTLNIFEVNRRECARIVLELPRWFSWGTFKGKQSLGPEPDELVDLEYTLESTLLEVTLAELSNVPFSSQPAIYYAALISELCKISPETVGPAVGKSIRKFYGLIGEGLDVEVARRLTDWFSVHMSNFTFNWVWKEWIPDLARPKYHPKRQFITRALELETRLAYHERIMKTLPEAFLEPDVQCVPEAAPGPEFEFESPQHPYYEPTQSLLNLIRARAPVDEVIPVAEALRNSIADTVSLPPNVTPASAVRTITMQILLHVGSRSISHFLNAIERYLPLLRTLGSSENTTLDGSGASGAPPKRDFLVAAARFWRRHGQMVSIVFDKLMQYQIADPSDIIGWSFRGFASTEDGANEDQNEKVQATIGVQAWDLLKAALDKAIGRVAIAQQRVQGLRKDEEDAKAKAMAVSASDAMDVDSEEAKRATYLKARVNEVTEALSNAEKALTALAREQRMALAKALEGFVAALTSETATTSETTAVLTADGWDARADWTREQWETWETWGWYRHFCRFYATQLKSNQITFEAGPLAGLALADEGTPARLVYTTWCAAIGRSTT